jgi:hypothetical protein
MHTLFFKIFGWFCAAVALIALSVFLVAWLTFRQPNPGPMRNPFTAFGIEAARVRKGGSARTRSLSGFLDEHFVNSTYLLDAQAMNLPDGLPPALKPLLLNAGRRPPPPIWPPPPPPLLPPPPHERA